MGFEVDKGEIIGNYLNILECKLLFEIYGWYGIVVII